MFQTNEQTINSSNANKFLPIANISRIMKQSLPDNAKISKEAKEAVQECVSEFIAFITSEACEICKNEKRKTINGDDILQAINTLGFETYNDILRSYLTKYREAVKQNQKNEDNFGPKDDQKDLNQEQDPDEEIESQNQ